MEEHCKMGKQLDICRRGMFLQYHYEIQYFVISCVIDSYDQETQLSQHSDQETQLSQHSDQETQLSQHSVKTS